MLNHKLERTIEISAWIVMIFLLLIFVPRNKIREAHVAFLFKQVVTWIFGLFVVEKNLISYPYRLFFRKANKASFTFEYFVYPALCSLFNVHYPEKRNYFYKFSHYFFYTAVITVFEAIAYKYTKLINYKKWTWYWSFLTIWFTYYISRIYHKWFFKDKLNARVVG